MKQLKYEKCRMIGHQWDEITGLPIDGQWIPEYNMQPLVLRCVNCSTIRKDAIDANGNLGYRLYEKPNDYHIPADLLPTRTQIREAWVKRQKRNLRLVKKAN